MKLTIGEYEVEVSAVHSRLHSEKDTKYFLNLLSLVFHDAARYNEEHMYEGLFRSYKAKADEIYNYLAEEGLYDE